MSGMARIIPWLAAGLAAAYLALAAVPVRDTPGKMAVLEAAKIPVADNGRVKPLDTLARTNLMLVSQRQYWTDDNKEAHTAMEWLLDNFSFGAANSDKALDEKVIRIDNDQVVQTLELKPRPEFWRYSVNEIKGKLQFIREQAMRADQKAEKDRDAADLQYLKLWSRFRIIQLAMAMSLETYCPIPPLPDEEDFQWKPLVQAFNDEKEGKEVSPALDHWKKMIQAYGSDNADSFNKEVAAYRQWCNDNLPVESEKAAFEVWFNNFEPFYKCTILYAFVLLLACLSWLAHALHEPGLPEAVSGTAFGIALVTLGLHTLGIGARMYIQARPPVTNLYTTAIFIGWVSLIITLIVERIYRNGIGLLVAGFIGFITMIIAHNLGTDGDTMIMMQAVLDTNFWLATHVTTINVGYAATMCAGVAGIVLVLCGVFTPWLTSDRLRMFAQAIYGILCFATLTSFVGTVLGGIWADQSWGRFWGWDPKENGALLIVIWNALILHARWGGLARPRGMAVLAIFGNIVTAWSWFGVNLLGVGLHAYGFMSGAVAWLSFFVITQLVLIGIGCVPTKFWGSYGTAPPKSPVNPDRRPRGKPDGPKGSTASPRKVEEGITASRR